MKMEIKLITMMIVELSAQVAEALVFHTAAESLLASLWEAEEKASKCTQVILRPSDGEHTF